MVSREHTTEKKHPNTKKEYLYEWMSTAQSFTAEAQQPAHQRQKKS